MTTITYYILFDFRLKLNIFFNFKRQLRKTGRIRVHKHLLSSLLIYSIMMAVLTLQIILPNSDPSSGSGNGVSNRASTVPSSSANTFEFEETTLTGSTANPSFSDITASSPSFTNSVQVCILI